MPNTPSNNPEAQNLSEVDEFVAKIEAAKDLNVKSIIDLLKLVSDNIEDSRIKEILESQSDFLRNIVIDSATAKESRALAEDFLSKKVSDEIDYSLKQYVYRVGNLLNSAFSEDLIQSLQDEEDEEGVDLRFTLPSPPPEFDNEDEIAIGEEGASLVNGAEEDETESDTKETGESEPPFRVSFMPDAPVITEQPSEASEVLREINGEPPKPAKKPSEPLPGLSDRPSILPLEREDYILFSDEQIAEADQALHWDMIMQLREGFEETKKDIDPSAQPGIQGLKEHLEYVEGKYKKKFGTDQPPVESNEDIEEEEEEDGDVGKVGSAFSDRYRRFRKRLRKDGKEAGDPGDDLDMRADRGGEEEVEEVDDKDIEDIIEDPESIEEDKSKTDSRLIIEQMPVTEELDMLKIGKPLNVEEDNHVRVFNALSGNKITVENNAVVTIDILFSNVNIQLDENNSFVVINKTSKNCQGNPVEIIITGKEKEGFNPVILGPKASKEHISVLYLG